VIVGHWAGAGAVPRAAFIKSRGLYDVVAQVIVIKQESLK
jgi:hypothetical protein